MRDALLWLEMELRWNAAGHSADKHAAGLFGGEIYGGVPFAYEFANNFCAQLEILRVQVNLLSGKGVKQSAAMADKTGEGEDDAHVQMWKVKQLIRKLSAARGNGTSMISLIIPPGDQISRVQKMLGDEFGTASNIKSRVTRQSVLSAITSTQQKLKIYTRVPPNGLVVYCGMIITGACLSVDLLCL